MSDEGLQTRINNDAANVVTANGMLNQLCAVIWLQDGRLQCLAPQGHDDAMALMLYRAADTFADRTLGTRQRFNNRKENP